MHDCTWKCPKPQVQLLSAFLPNHSTFKKLLATNSKVMIIMDNNMEMPAARSQLQCTRAFVDLKANVPHHRRWHKVLVEKRAA